MYCFTELLRNFAVVEIPRQRDALEDELTKDGRSFRWVKSELQSGNKAHFDPIDVKASQTSLLAKMKDKERFKYNLFEATKLTNCNPKTASNSNLSKNWVTIW